MPVHDLLCIALATCILHGCAAWRAKDSLLPPSATNAVPDAAQALSRRNVSIGRLTVAGYEEGGSERAGAEKVSPVISLMSVAQSAGALPVAPPPRAAYMWLSPYPGEQPYSYGPERAIAGGIIGGIIGAQFGSGRGAHLAAAVGASAGTMLGLGISDDPCAAPSEGSALGALIGAALGYQIGSGSGRTAASAVGATLGALAGTQAGPPERCR